MLLPPGWLCLHPTQDSTSLSSPCAQSQAALGAAQVGAGMEQEAVRAAGGWLANEGAVT